MFKNDQYISRNLLRFRKIFDSIVAGHSCKHLCECLTTFFFFHGALAIPQSNFFWYFLLKQAQFLGVMLALLARSFQPPLRFIKALGPRFTIQSPGSKLKKRECQSLQQLRYFTCYMKSLCSKALNYVDFVFCKNGKK